MAGVTRGSADTVGGNSYLLKHAPNVTGCAQMIARILTEAGTPAGVYGWVNANNEGVSQMINNPRIAAVTVTGSVRAGAAIGAQAGAALKKCVLELGGSDPFIVLNDADLELAVKAAVAGRYQNTDKSAPPPNVLLSKRALRRRLPIVLWRLPQH